MGIWGLEFDKISMADLIQHQSLRSVLSAAEGAISVGDYKDVAARSVAALRWTLNKIGEPIVGKTIWRNTLILTSEIERDTSETLSRIQQVLLLTILGFSLRDHAQFRKMVDDLRVPFFLMLDGSNLESLVTDARPQITPSATEAEFMLAYATDAIIQIEELVGGLDRPFGV